MTAAPGAAAAMTPRDRRRLETRREILDAAWDLARTEGLTGFSLRQLGPRVGLKASSLYSYFESKSALYDAMFRDGYADLLNEADVWEQQAEEQSDRALAFLETNRAFFRLSVGDPIRYQLLFQRTVPNWEPSPDSYADAVRYLERLRAVLADIDIVDDAALDMWTAIMTGLTSQQLSNDPGGDRWLRLVDDAVEMFLRHYHST